MVLLARLWRTLFFAGLDPEVFTYCYLFWHKYNLYFLTFRPSSGVFDRADIIVSLHVGSKFKRSICIQVLGAEGPYPASGRSVNPIEL